LLWRIRTSDNKDERHIDRVVVDEKVELVEPVNQYITPFTPKFEVVYVDDQYGCNDWLIVVGIQAY